jgi:hypothetical protein
MATNEKPSPVPVQNLFLQLTEAAANFDSASDELAKPVAEIDAAFKKLNLGVIVWTRMEGGPHSEASEYWWSQDIGYTKISGKWGVALRSCSGDYTDPERDSVEEWLFNDAPRRMRILGIQHIPDLIRAMVEEVNKTTSTIKSKITEANELAKAIRDIPQPAKKK